MDRGLFSKLTEFSNFLQGHLFPRLELETGLIEGKLELFVACCAMIPFHRLLGPGRGWNGRPSKDRQSIARAFLAKSVFGLVNTRQLLDILRRDTALRSLCGWSSAAAMPHESTFSRAFAEFAKTGLAQAAHDALIASTHSGRLVGHISRDSSAIHGWERFPEPPVTGGDRTGKGRKKAVAKKVKAKARKKAESRKAAVGAQKRQTQQQRLESATRLERQAAMKEPAAMLAGVPLSCDLGVKTSSGGNQKYWRGFKLHLDVADGQIPITAVITAASVHDSQVAIPMMHMTSGKVTYLYDVCDSAYDAAPIREVSERLNHKPVIDYHTRPTGPTQLPCRVKPQPELSPAERIRYRERTAVERVFGRLKQEFGADFVRVRGTAKVMTHLMFGVMALTVDALLRLHR